MESTAAALIDLPSHEAHLWYLLPDEVDDPTRLDSYLGWLSPDEHARRDRYLFERNKREYLLTRALVRWVLSRYADVEPAAWTFAQNEYGRPEIATPEHAWIRFNLTNTHGLLAMLVAREREVGVDVESRERRGENVNVADRFFSPIEVNELRSLPIERQRSRFFDYWTLKEAYIKARGMGLAIPLDQFSFLLVEGEPIRIEFDPRLVDDPASWQFEHVALTAVHQTSVAIRRGRGEPRVRVVLRKTVPGVEETLF